LPACRPSCLRLLLATRHADDLPEDFSYRLRRQSSFAGRGRHTSNHRGLSRWIENRKTGDSFELTRPLAKHESLGKKRDDLVVDALDLIPTDGDFAQCRGLLGR